LLDWEFDLHVGAVLAWCMAGDAPDSLAWDAGGHADTVQPGRKWSASASSNYWKSWAPNIPTIYIHTHTHTYNSSLSEKTWGGWTSQN
jgi:hypothetical protein